MAPYTYNGSNQLLSTPGATYTYDNNGNTTSKTDASGTTGYTWDYENRLTSVALPGSGGAFSFTYDPFGRRIRIVSPSGTVIYAYDGDNIVDQMDATGAWQSRFTHGLGVDEPLEIRQQSVPLYYHADGLGSIAAVTNAARAVAASYTYDAFGQTTMQTQIVVSPFGFTGREFSNGDGNTPGPDLYYYRARYYDPSVGRLLSEDPLSFSAGINFYAYVANNPTLLSDPFGLDPREKCGPAKPCDLSNVKITPGDPLTRDANVVFHFYCLWVKAGYGFQATERAAWVVKSGNTFNLSLLPFTNEPGRVTFLNERPLDSVAFAHTHPNPPRSSPKPSEADQIAANQIRLPVYTVSRSAIYKSVPGAKQPVEVAGESWWEALRKCKCD
jgi:RHS repeat-associated protein